MKTKLMLLLLLLAFTVHPAFVHAEDKAPAAPAEAGMDEAAIGDEDMVLEDEDFPADEDLALDEDLGAVDQAADAVLPETAEAKQ